MSWSAAETVRTWRHDSWVVPFFRQYWRVLALAVALGLATFLFAALLMCTSGYLISGSASAPESILVLNIPLIFVRIFGIGKPILHYLERLASHDWVLRMTSGLRCRLYAALGSTPPFQVVRRTGDVLGLVAEDIGHIQNLYLRTVFPLVVAWLLGLVLVVVAGCFSPFAALALALMVLAAAVVAPLVSVLVNGARRMRAKTVRAELYAQLTDNVLGVSDWVFADRGDDYLARYRSCEQGLREAVRAEERFNRWRDLVLEAVFALTAVALLAWAAGRFGGQPGEAANWIAAVVLGFFPLIEAFAPLSTAAVDALSYTDSTARLNSLPTPSGEQSSASHPMPQAPYDICIEHVTYCYPGAKRAVLDDMCLEVPYGQKVAVLGRSGAGKSTLAMLIRGDSAPVSGRVLIGGVPASSLGDDVSRFVGIIQQDPYVFNMSLIDNVRIGAPDATEAEVTAVLEAVGLGPLLRRLPEGLDTMAGEAGLRFSGGERHRIALARVLLQDAPIVVLDEPMVGLDPLTEQALLRDMLSALAGRTVIMATHHLQGAGAMDRVVFVEDGSIALDGAPGELERTSSFYRHLLAFDRGDVA